MLQNSAALSLHLDIQVSAPVTYWTVCHIGILTNTTLRDICADQRREPERCVEADQN